MFEFLFRRAKPAPTPSTAPGSSTNHVAPTVSGTTGKTGKSGKSGKAGKAVSAAVQPASKEAAAAQARAEALAQAAALQHDEAGAIAFICASNVPEARLLAAQAVRGRDGLEQVRRRLRDTDRRVVRLMQQRLEMHDREAAAQAQAGAVVEDARQLQKSPVLRANQVVALEHAWHAITAVTSPLQDEFQALHDALGKRLQAQALLQRRMLDAVEMIRRTLSTTANVTTSRIAEPDALESTSASASDSLQSTRLAELTQDIDQLLQQIEADPELGSLPKQLMPDLARSRAQLQERLDASLAHEAALAARQQADALAEQGRNARFNESVVAPGDGAPAVAESDATPHRDAAAGRKHATPVETPERREERTAALHALQAALEDGALLKAMEQDRLLRVLDGDGIRLAASQKAALQAARAELGRLQGWARWGGAVSRDELVAAVEALPQQALSISELGKKVGSMRERWRAMDATAGAASRTAWIRFDAACTAAHAPVAVHRAALDAERSINADKAQTLLAETMTFRSSWGLALEDQSTTGQAVPAAAQVDITVDIDWRALSAFCQKQQQAWRQLGPLERREQKRLNVAFAQAMQPLLDLLKQRQAQEFAARQQLIASVSALPPQARDTPEKLQALQAQWQQQAKAVPLARPQEQSLWEQFRAACDAVFAARKEVGAAADAQRAASLVEKRALCEELERMAADAAGNPPSAARMRALQATWDAAGAVPRALADALHERHAAALAALDGCASDARRLAAARQGQDILAAVILCLDTERDGLQANAETSAAKAQEAWDRLPALPVEFAAVLQQRFNAALNALNAPATPDPEHAQQLQSGQAERDRLLMQLEVSLGLASPERLTRERMALQVADLQAALQGAGNKTRTTAKTSRSLLVDMLAITAAADTEARIRITKALLAAQGE